MVWVPCPGNMNAVSVPFRAGEKRKVKRGLLLDFHFILGDDFAAVVVPALWASVVWLHLAWAFGAFDDGGRREEQVGAALASPRSGVFLLWYWSAWHWLSVFL